jgi:hypothetical protein
MMLSVMDMYFQEIEKNKKVTDADEDDEEDNHSDATITRINSEAVPHVRHHFCRLPTSNP